MPPASPAPLHWFHWGQKLSRAPRSGGGGRAESGGSERHPAPTGLSPLAPSPLSRCVRCRMGARLRVPQEDGAEHPAASLPPATVLGCPRQGTGCSSLKREVLREGGERNSQEGASPVLEPCSHQLRIPRPSSRAQQIPRFVRAAPSTPQFPRGWVPSGAVPAAGTLPAGSPEPVPSGTPRGTPPCPVPHLVPPAPTEPFPLQAAPGPFPLRVL